MRLWLLSVFLCLLTRTRGQDLIRPTSVVEDIDECMEGTHDCEKFCTNGSIFCSLFHKEWSVNDLLAIAVGVSAVLVLTLLWVCIHKRRKSNGAHKKQPSISVDSGSAAPDAETLQMQTYEHHVTTTDVTLTNEVETPSQTPITTANSLRRENSNAEYEEIPDPAPPGRRPTNTYLQLLESKEAAAPDAETVPKQTYGHHATTTDVTVKNEEETPRQTPIITANSLRRENSNAEYEEIPDPAPPGRRPKLTCLQLLESKEAAAPDAETVPKQTYGHHVTTTDVTVTHEEETPSQTPITTANSAAENTTAAAAEYAEVANTTTSYQHLDSTQIRRPLPTTYDKL